MEGRAKGKRVSRPIPRLQDNAAERTTVPLADISNTRDGDHKFQVGDVKFKEPRKSPSGNGEYTVGYTSLKFGGEI